MKGIDFIGSTVDFRMEGGEGGEERIRTMFRTERRRGRSEGSATRGGTERSVVDRTEGGGFDATTFARSAIFFERRTGRRRGDSR